MKSINIIKRTFSHHHSAFTKFPVSGYINHFDKEKADETNKNVLDINVKINNIDNKVNSINAKVRNMDAYLFIHFIIMHSIYMPIIIFKM